MRKLIQVVAAAVLALVPVAARAQTPSDGGAGWRWLVTPDILQAGLILGERAGTSRTGDAVTIECRLDRNYRPSDCIATGDKPDQGLIDAAAQIAAMYRAASKDATGASTSGRRVRFSFTVGDTGVL